MCCWSLKSLIDMEMAKQPCFASISKMVGYLVKHEGSRIGIFFWIDAKGSCVSQGNSREVINGLARGSVGHDIINLPSDQVQGFQGTSDVCHGRDLFGPPSETVDTPALSMESAPPKTNIL